MWWWHSTWSETWLFSVNWSFGAFIMNCTINAPRTKSSKIIANLWKSEPTGITHAGKAQGFCTVPAVNVTTSGHSQIAYYIFFPEMSYCIWWHTGCIFSPEKITLHSKFKNKPPSLGSSVTPITFGCKLQHFLKGKSRKVQHRHLETLIPAFVKFRGFTGVDLFSFKNDWNFCTNYSVRI